MTDCINCPNCGAPVDLTAEKCPYCGTPYPRTRETDQTDLDSLAAAMITPNEARRLMGLPRIWEENIGRRKKQMDRIALKNAAARAEGLSYGQWVAKHPEGLPPGFEPEEPEELEEIETPAREPAPRTKKHGIPVKPLPALMPCIVCGREFKPKAPNAKYCGLDCARKREREKQATRRGGRLMPDKMPCAICGREFKPNAPNSKYCGDSCVEEAARRRAAAKIERNRAARQQMKEVGKQ